MSKGDKARELVRLQAILYQALNEPIGLVLRTSDAVKARMRLYQARAASGDEALDRLQFRLAPWGRAELLITKGAAKPQENPSVVEPGLNRLAELD